MMDKIRIGDFQFTQSEREAIIRVMDSGRISEWREVKAFEEEFADWVGTKYCVAVSSGTAALIVGLKTLEYLEMVPRGASVLIPALTFVADANAIELSGMQPLFADVDLWNYTMRPDSIRKADPDVVLPVHLFGSGADIMRINKEICMSGSHMVLCEDACEAHGTMIDGQRAGSLSTWGAFSFYIAHTVQAGELGVLVTNNADIARVARQIKAHGRMCTCTVCTRSTTGCPKLKNGDPRFMTEFIGYNFKPMEWSAALARVQLHKVSENIARRKANAKILSQYLSQCRDVDLPEFAPTDVPMVYPMVLRHDMDRDEILVTLESKGVEARPMFNCIPLQQPAYSEYKKQYEGHLPVSEMIGRCGFYVGCHQYLTQEQLERMAEVILESVKQ